MANINALELQHGFLSRKDGHIEGALHMEGDSYVYQTLGSTEFASGFAGYGVRVYKDGNGK